MNEIRCLVVSFSDINHDPRLKRQIFTLSRDYKVYTAGYGAALPVVEGHCRFNSDRPIWLKIIFFLLLQIRLYSVVFRLFAGSKSFRRTFAFLQSIKPDLLVLNDVTSWPLVDWLPSIPCILDAHEYSPLEMQHDLFWRMFIKPYKLWCSSYGVKASAVTSVEPNICMFWEEYLGREVALIRNLAPYSCSEFGLVKSPAIQDSFVPQCSSSLKVPGSIQVLHHGAANPSRRLELMMKAVGLAGPAVEADFYLAGLKHGLFGAHIRAIAASIPNLKLREPVPSDQLIQLGSGYDVGFLSVYPSNINNQYCMPNKFFEFLQSGLPVVIGPTPALAEIVNAYHCGIVAEDFTPAALAEALCAVTPERLCEWAPGVRRAARELCWEREQDRFLGCVNSVLSAAG